VLEKLLTLGVSVNVNDQSGNNIFHLSVSGAMSEDQCVSVLEVFFKSDSYQTRYQQLLNKRNIAGQTPTHMATVKGFNQVIKMFHKFGADLDLKVKFNNLIYENILK